MGGGGLELLGDTRRQVAGGEQRLRVARGNEVELAVVVELADRVQRRAAARASESERCLELRPLRLGRPAPGQQPVTMLPRDAELSRQIRDRQPLAPQKPC